MLEPFLNPIAGEQRVFVVSADSSYQDYLQAILEAGGFRVETASRVEEARERLTLLGADVVLWDLGSARNGDEQILGSIRSASSPLPWVVLTDAKEFARAAELLVQGAADYLIRPFSAEALVQRVGAALLRNRGCVPGTGAAPGGGEAAFPPRRDSAGGSEARGDSDTAAVNLPADLILGRSPATQRVIEQVHLVAPKRTTVLITGETGTGKERVAQAIHAFSLRRDKPMIPVNCGGIPASLLEDEFFGHVRGAFTDAHQARLGRFEQAHRSTIFLDEIGDLPLELQPKLLRVLQEREIHRIGGSDTIRVDARVIAATNVDLWSRVAEGRFREDLFYRINVFPIHLPPLRERREDIPVFVDYFLERFCRRDRLRRKRLDPQTRAELMAWPWPGNIRELENAVEIAVIRSGDRPCIGIEDFSKPRQPLRSAPALANLEAKAVDLKQMVSEFERELITHVLRRTGGNKTQAAELLQVKRTTLIEKLKRFDQEDEAEEAGQASDPTALFT